MTPKNLKSAAITFEYSKAVFLLMLLFCLSIGQLLLAQAPQGQNLLGKDNGLRFEENKGQLADSEGNLRKDILFTMKANGINLYFTRDGISYQWHYTEKILNGPLNVSEATGLRMKDEDPTTDKFKKPDSIILHTYSIDMNWTEPNENVEVVAEEAYEDYNNYYLAHCPQGVLGVKSYKRLIYKNLYPNIDVVYYVKDSHLKYDVVVHENGNLSDLKFKYNGAEPKLINGKVRIETPLGFLEEQEPIAFYRSGEEVGVNYKFSRNQVSFDSNVKEDLLIDPQLLWATYYGGGASIQGTQVNSTTVDANDNVFIFGRTSCSSGISSGGFQQIYGGGAYDAYLVKFDKLGTRLWATYYGGADYENGYDVTTDLTGNVFITGETTSTLGIASGGHQNTLSGGSDVFLAKLSSGGSLIWATYFGGPGAEYGGSLIVDINNDVIISGYTLDSNSGIAFNGYQNVSGGAWDIFMAKFTSSGGLVWGTYFGGSDDEYAGDQHSIDVDQSGNIYLAGSTKSTSGIAIGGQQMTFGGVLDGVLAKFNSSGILQWSTYYGGSENDGGYSTSVDSDGNIYFAGATYSTNNISLNGYQNSLSGSVDGFLAKLNNAGVLLWGTYYGGTAQDVISTIVAKGTQSVFVVGKSYSSDGIAGGGYQNSLIGGYNSIVAKFNSSGSFQWGTYYGGGDNESLSISLDSNGNIYFGGNTTAISGIASNGFLNAYTPPMAGFLVKMNDAIVAPTTQATNTSFTSRTANSMILNFTNGDAASRIVVAKAGAPVDSDPVNGVSYTSNSVFGLGTQLGSGNYVVGLGSGPFLVTGLTDATTYYFRVYEFNGTGGTEIYDISAATGNPGSAGTLFNEPLSQASFSSTSLATTTSLTLNLSNGNGSSRIILAKSGSAVDSNPVDGATYIANNIFGQGSQLGTGNFVVGTGAGPVTVTGLTAGTTYYFKIYEFNGTGGTENYNLDAIVGSSISAPTISTAPTTITPTAIQTTSFQANWTTSIGAVDYRLDLSIDNFANLIVGYDNLTVTGTSKVITGLSNATLYQYRIRANNTSGVSGNSNISQALTFPSDVVASAATSITQINFTANWTSIPGISDYRLDVSNDNFVTLLTGYDNLPVSGTSKVVTATSGTLYQYRVRATNASGIGANSNTINVLTKPGEPIAAASSLITQTGFTANWNSVTGAVSYLLDISTDDFVTFVSGYNGLVVNTTSTVVSGLTPATTYKYRVRANNATGDSGNSNSILVLTIPSDVVASAATLVTQTGFTANWGLAAGVVSNYQLDLSTDNFLTLEPGYDNLSVATNTKTIVALPGTTYKYRVRSANSSGTSSSSNATSVLTVPANPVATVATSINQTGFIANWNSVTGVANYVLDISNDDFSTLLPGYSGLVVNATSKVVTGLNNATTYKYRIRASNTTGDSGNSNIISLVTTPANPSISITPNSTTQDGFTLNWTAVTGADTYLLEISTSSNFANNDAQYNNVEVTGIQKLVTGLAAGQIYFTRLSAKNSSGVSGTSNVVSQLLIASNPVLNNPTLIGTTSFKVSWGASTGADKYLLEVSKDDFVSLLAGYNPKEILTGLEDFVSGLVPNTVYKFRLKAVNASGLSKYSNVKSVQTLPVTSSLQMTVNTPVTVSTGTKIGVTLTGGTGSPVVKLYTRGICSSTFTETILPSTGNVYESTINHSQYDELGLEYYFTASDASTSTPISSNHSFLYESLNNSEAGSIPFKGSHDGSKATYEMFSIPYVIGSNSIASVFDELGKYDKTKWRLYHFQGNKYVENEDGLNSIELGKGYWFNTKEKVEIKPGAINVTDANQSKPYQMTFEKGWNQIGNPYPFNIDWNTIKDANPSVGLNSIWLFESSKYTKKDVLASWKGAFVFSDNGGNASFPVSSKTSASGRAIGSVLSSEIDDEAWQVPITLTLNGLEQVSSFGMHPEARLSKDRFDEITIPRFLDYLEMDTYHEDFFVHYFASDIITTTNTSSWLFTVSSSQKAGKATLSWDQQAMSDSKSQLALLDLQAQTLVDMKTTNIYRFNWNEGRKFKILYSNDGELLPGVTLLGDAYPNPFNADVKIPFTLETDQSAIDIILYDLMGRKVKTLRQHDAKAGIHHLDWEGNNEQGSPVDSGIYLYQLKGDRGVLSQPKRLLKK